MTTYCSICRQSTEDMVEKKEWNRGFKLIVVHCGKCGLFKYQYLEDSKEISSSE